MAKSAKAKAAAQLLDKRPRQQLTERTEKAEEARFEGSFRCNIYVGRCVPSKPHLSDPSQTLISTYLLSGTLGLTG